MRLLRIYLLNERTMLQSQTEGKTQERAKGLTFKVLLHWISSICSSSPPSSTLPPSPPQLSPHPPTSAPSQPQKSDLYGLHQWASLPSWFLSEDYYLN